MTAGDTATVRPHVPDWIRQYVPPPGWTNVFQLVPDNGHLYGTETLFGDWDGKVLLLAKDGAPTHVIRSLRDRGDKRPWRHAQRELGDVGGWRSNEWLQQAARSLPCGKLYGSATAHLLYDHPAWSRSLPGFFTGPMHQHLCDVLEWVLANMRNIKAIGCLGYESWFLTATVLGRPDVARSFAAWRDSSKVLTVTKNGILLHAVPLYHPAARVSDSDKSRGWPILAGLI